MVCRLIVFALVVFESLMFKVCGIIGISKIEFFNFSGNERVKHMAAVFLFFFSLNDSPEKVKKICLI